MENMKLKIFIFTTVIFFQPVLCIASSLTLNIDSSTKIYKDPNQFELSVIFKNTSDKPIIVFPAYLRRKYTPLDNQRLQFSPYEGPVRDPWSGAFSLESGQSKSVAFDRMQDGGGHWSLAPGRYDLIVTLNILPNNYYFQSPSKKIEGIDIWLGKIESESLKINYLK